MSICLYNVLPFSFKQTEFYCDDTPLDPGPDNEEVCMCACVVL